MALFLADLPKQLLPFGALFFVLLNRHPCLGVPALKVRPVHRAIQTKLAEKFLPIGTEKKIGKKQRSVRVRDIRRHRHSTGVRRYDVHRHPLNRRAFRNGDAGVAQKRRR